MRQKGEIALLLLVTILVMAAAYFLTGSVSIARQKIENDKITARALAQAKDALVGFAITYGDTHPGNVHGYLPCPDTSGADIGGEGGASGSCGAKDVSAIGRLPWKTLDLPPLRDGSGECLWYAVSGTYKYNPKTDLMNWDNNGLFQVMAPDGVGFLAGSSPDNQAVAVVFAPGVAMGSQSRSAAPGTNSCGGNYTPSNYLDNDTLHGIDNAAVSSIANAVTRFVAGPVQNTPGNAIVNDKLIFITRDDIFNAMLRRADFADPARNPLRLVTRKAAECLAHYAARNGAGIDDKRIPWASSVSLGDYGSDASYDDAEGRLYGRLPYRVNTSRPGTANAIVYPYYQLQGNGANCPAPASDWTNKYYPWWTNWKDQLFYVLADAYQPDAGSSPSCGTCLSVNGSGAYIGIVLFSGRKIGSQVRLTSSDRGNFANYLEGANSANFSASRSEGSYQVAGFNTDFRSAGETATFNDWLYCINPDLAVAPC